MNSRKLKGLHVYETKSLTVELLKVKFFWNVTPCRLVSCYVLRDRNTSTFGVKESENSSYLRRKMCITNVRKIRVDRDQMDGTPVAFMKAQ